MVAVEGKNLKKKLFKPVKIGHSRDAQPVKPQMKNQSRDAERNEAADEKPE